MSRRRRRRYREPPMTQPEMQWIEDGINIIIETLIAVVVGIGVLVWGAVRGLYLVVCVGQSSGKGNQE